VKALLRRSQRATLSTSQRDPQFVLSPWCVSALRAVWFDKAVPHPYGIQSVALLLQHPRPAGHRADPSRKVWGYELMHDVETNAGHIRHLAHQAGTRFPQTPLQSKRCMELGIA